MDQLQGLMPADPKMRSTDKDLPGFRSHVRYSVFKDRRDTSNALRESEERTRNLASTIDVVNATQRGGVAPAKVDRAQGAGFPAAEPR